MGIPWRGRAHNKTMLLSRLGSHTETSPTSYVEEGDEKQEREEKEERFVQSDGMNEVVSAHVPECDCAEGDSLYPLSTRCGEANIGCYSCRGARFVNDSLFWRRRLVVPHYCDPILACERVAHELQLALQRRHHKLCSCFAGALLLRASFPERASAPWRRPSIF